jgi:hypothetical protein
MTQGSVEDNTSPDWGNMFESEEAFLSVLDEHDQLIQRCANGAITFQEFEKKYNYFYGHYALDGHESDEQEREMFEKYDCRIKPHEELGTEVFQHLCSDEDAVKNIYIQAGRFGSDEGLRRLRIVNQKYFGTET